MYNRKQIHNSGEKTMRKYWIWIVLILFTCILIVFGYERAGLIQFGTPSYEPLMNNPKPVENKDNQAFAVSANHPLAVEAGMDVLNKGGNAADAAVAVSYVLAVVEPFGSGLGGGGAAIVLQDGKAMSYDYKEIAPYSGETPEIQAGIPGFVKGIENLHEDYGSLEMDELMEPAIKLAKEGFEADQYLVDRLQAASYRISKSSASPFFNGDTVIEVGETIKQPELAETLERVKENGAKGFYEGEMATELAQALGVKKSDFRKYEVEKEPPVESTVFGYRVLSSPPPLGGTTLEQILKLAETFDFKNIEPDQADFPHALGEFIKVAYEKRLDTVADPRYFSKDMDKLVTDSYIESLKEDLDLSDLPSDVLLEDSTADKKGYDNTTHFVIADREGTMISATHSLGNFFGSGTMINGMFINNSLSHFSTNENSLNKKEPGKRPRSHSAPMILVNDEKLIGIGSPGGKRIPMILSQVLLRHIVYGEELQEAIDAPRFIIEGNKIYVEETMSDDSIGELSQRGYDVYLKENPFFYGGVQALVIDEENNQIYGGADRRRIGTWDASKIDE